MGTRTMVRYGYAIIQLIAGFICITALVRGPRGIPIAIGGLITIALANYILRNERWAADFSMLLWVISGGLGIIAYVRDEVVWGSGVSAWPVIVVSVSCFVALWYVRSTMLTDFSHRADPIILPRR